MIYKYSTLLLLLVILCPGVVMAAPGNTVQVIQLQGRTAEEMIPMLRSLIKPGDALSGTGYQLIIRTDPQTLSEVRSVLDQLDRTPRNLVVSVRRSKVGESHRQEVHATGAIKLGRDARVGVGDFDGQGLQARIEDRTATANERGVQQLRVLEGNRAFINTGQQIPYPENNVVIRPGGTVINKTTRYKNVSQGFYVKPRISGDRVTLSITASDGNVLPNQSIAVQQTGTVVHGRVGEWIQIGGIQEQSRSSNRGILSARDQRTSSANDIYIKVEPE